MLATRVPSCTASRLPVGLARKAVQLPVSPGLLPSVIAPESGCGGWRGLAAASQQIPAHLYSPPAGMTGRHRPPPTATWVATNISSVGKGFLGSGSFPDREQNPEECGLLVAEASHRLVFGVEDFKNGD